MVSSTGLGAITAQYAPERASLGGSQAVLGTLDVELGLGTGGRRRDESAVGKEEIKGEIFDRRGLWHLTKRISEGSQRV